MREATQQAFEQLVLRVRRNLAPHLKGLMGSWLVAQCDAYAPAASAATAAFQAAFPPTKQTEAVFFCRQEVISVSGHTYEYPLGRQLDSTWISLNDMPPKHKADFY